MTETSGTSAVPTKSQLSPANVFCLRHYTLGTITICLLALIRSLPASGKSKTTPRAWVGASADCLLGSLMAPIMKLTSSYVSLLSATSNNQTTMPPPRSWLGAQRSS